MINPQSTHLSFMQRAAMDKYLTPFERSMLHIVRNALAPGIIVAIGVLVTSMTHGATWQATLIAVSSSFLTVIIGAVITYARANGQSAMAKALEYILKDAQENTPPTIPPSPPTS